MLYRIMAAVIFASFYLIYLIKMLDQKRHGIQTTQIGSRKEKGLHTVELLMSVATVCAPLSHIISIIIDWSWLPNFLRMIGAAIGFIGVLIFLISVATMKNSWRAGIPETDKTELIQNGIYRWSRNPAFVGFDLMYIGLSLMFCNVVTVIFSLFAIVMLHLQILQEEKYLAGVFGAAYIEYKSKVFRYIGRKR